jgi:hypothetical protein
MQIASCARYGKTAAFIAVFTAAFLGAAWQQQEELPDAREIIDRFVEAIGGEQAIKSSGARHMLGRMDVPAQGVGGDLELFTAPPNKMLFKIEVPGIGSISSGYDGEVGWAINPAMGPMVLEGRMLEQLRQQADFRAVLHPDDLIAAMETVEKTEVEGHSCYKVKVTTTWGEEYFEFFDTETGLQVGSERSQASPMGEIPTTSVVSEYQEFDGLLVATKTSQRMMGIEQERYAGTPVCQYAGGGCSMRKCRAPPPVFWYGPSGAPPTGHRTAHRIVHRAITTSH